MLFLHLGHLGGVPFTMLSHTAAASSGFAPFSDKDLSLYLPKDLHCNVTNLQNTKDKNQSFEKEKIFQIKYSKSTAVHEATKLFLPTYMYTQDMKIHTATSL